jgi:hypothetical protein
MQPFLGNCIVAIEPSTGTDRFGERIKRIIARRWYLLVGAAVILGLILFFRREESAIVDRVANTASVLGLFC